MSTMRAVRLHAYGGPQVLTLEEAPLPRPGPGQVLIRVLGAGINPLDWKVRAGHLQEMLKYPLPLIPGWDLSGKVEEVGQDVTGFKLGDAVYGMLDLSEGGGYAQYVALKASSLAPKPSNIDHLQAASAPLASLTAWQSLFEAADLEAGQTVLIHAAAGGVGHLAVQLAKWKGARVIGTASARNKGFLEDLGADEVIDYRTARFEEAVQEVDLVLDTIGGETQERSWQVLKQGGTLVGTLGIASPDAAQERGLRGEGVLVHPDGSQLARITELIEAGDLMPFVSTVLPLKEAAKAHELSQGGHVRGKIVLEVGG